MPENEKKVWYSKYKHHAKRLGFSPRPANDVELEDLYQQWRKTEIPNPLTAAKQLHQQESNK